MAAAVAGAAALAAGWIFTARVPSGTIGLMETGRPGEAPRTLTPGFHFLSPGATVTTVPTTEVTGSGKVMVAPLTGGELELSYTVSGSLSTTASPDLLAALPGRRLEDLLASRAGTLLTDYAAGVEAAAMLDTGQRQQAGSAVAAELGRQGFERISMTVNQLDDSSLLAAAQAFASRGEGARIRPALAEALQRPEAATSWKLHTAMGMVNESEKRFDEAVENYFDALAIDPAAEPPMAQIVVLFGAKQDWMRLGRALDAALTAAPRSLQHINWTAMVLLKQEDYVGAERILKSGLEIDPSNSTLLANLGAMYSKRGRLEEAEQMFRRAVEAAPDNAQACFNLGSLLATRDQFDEALALLQRAEAAGSSSYPLVRALAAVHGKLGHSAEAADYRRRAQQMEATLKQRRSAAQEAADETAARAPRTP